MTRRKETALAHPVAPSKWASIREAERVSYSGAVATPPRMDWKAGGTYTCPELQHRSRGAERSQYRAGQAGGGEVMESKQLTQAGRVQLARARRNRVYVAGPMSGMPGHNFPAFNAAADSLRAQGWHVENPAEHGEVDGATWADYMHCDVAMLASCSAIHLLPGWSKSRGATLEAYIAAALGMQFQYAEGAEPALPAAVHEAVAGVLVELRRALAKFPTWPTDPLHAIAVVNEEVGELNKELLQLTYEPHKVKPEGVHTEAVQSAAMTLRFLASMGRYEFRECVQHSQAVTAVEVAQ